MLRILPIPVPATANHPLPPSEILPKHEFTMGLIAPKGSGKTTAIANLLRIYSNFFHTIVIFSPTLHSDEKWKWVRDQDLVAENIPFKNFLKRLQQEHHEGSVVTGSDWAFGQEKQKPFSAKIPEQNFLTEYDDSFLESIMNEQAEVIKFLEAHGETKHLANRILLIFDDMVGSKLFSSHRKNPFKKLNTNHRHYSASILMVAQAYKEIIKTVRTQFSCLILFKVPNRRELAVIYEENPVFLEEEQWMEMYNYATSVPYSFLFINYQRPIGEQLTRNLEELLAYH